MRIVDRGFEKKKHDHKHCGKDVLSLAHTDSMLVDVVVAVATDVVTLINNEAAFSVLTGGTFCEDTPRQTSPNDDQIILLLETMMSTKEISR